MPANPDAASYALRFGPYAPPEISIGDEIQCEVRGLVEVADWSDRGAIMWPRCATSRRRALIVAGDLARAVALETELAVAKLWGVTPHTVMKWKRAVSAPARTPGTEVVSSQKARESMTGREALPQVKAALLRAAKRPKSRAWREALAERNRARGTK